MIKRSRRIVKRKACIAGGAGYIRSAVALAGEELPQKPDLMASLVWFFGKMQKYDKSRGPVQLDEVWKKWLACGIVTASQLEEERALHGVDLHDEG